MRESRVAEAQKVSTIPPPQSPSPMPTLFIASLTPGHFLPYPPSDHRDHRLALRQPCGQLCAVLGLECPSIHKPEAASVPLLQRKQQQHEDSGSATRHGILISPFSHFLLVPSLPSLPSYLRDQSFFRVRACAPRRALDGRSQGTLRLHIPACFGFSFFLSMPKLCVFVSHGRNHFDFELNI